MDEQQDLNVEPTEKRGPGRPPGSKSRTQTRQQTKLRVRDWRQKQREKAELEAEAAEQDAKSQERLFRDMRANHWHFFSEVQPTINAETIHAELTVAREFGRALGLPDVQVGDTPRQYITSVFTRWIETGCHAFIRSTQTFASKTFDSPDVAAYVWLPGSDDAIAEVPALVTP